MVREDARILTKDEAKPCPFCGSQREIQPWHGGGPRKRLVSCSEDTCVVSPATTGSTKKWALINWNTRRTPKIEG